MKRATLDSWKGSIIPHLSTELVNQFIVSLSVLEMPEYLELPTVLDQATAHEEVRKALAKFPLELSSGGPDSYALQGLFLVLHPDSADVATQLLNAAPTMFISAYNHYIRIKTGM